LETSQARVLVVDDYEPFRQFVYSRLRKRPELQIVGEASDGLEALNKAEELQPNLILLDIGLPTLNGVEAARRIRKLAPDSKIIFVSQEFSADVVEEALALGALGFVAKAHAGRELVPAVEAVRQGRQFVRVRFRILVVDDEPSIRETARIICEGEGYEVLTAADGLEGLHSLSKSLPDLIISDLNMPRMTGFEFLSVVRQRFPHIPTIAMSGGYSSGEMPAGILADSFLQKGNYTIKELCHEVGKLLAASPLRSEGKKSNIAPLFAPKDSAGTLPCIDDDRSSSPVRVLVVEDFEPFRRSVCSMLDKRADLQIVGEVSDGLEAVIKATKLQPDLILLDVGLPSMNGIEAARRIRNASPESKILFVTQESADDVVQEALNLGAWGYVVKTRVGSDLSAAVESVRQGRRFVSSGLAAHLTEATDAHAQRQLPAQ